MDGYSVQRLPFSLPSDFAWLTRRASSKTADSSSVKESTNLDDLAFLERQLLISSVGIRRHGHGVIVKESHKHSGHLLRLQVVVVVLGAPSPSVPVPTGAIWNIEEASAATTSLVPTTLAIKAPRAQDVSLRADGERATRCLRMRKSHVEPFSARRYQCVFVLFKGGRRCRAGLDKTLRQTDTTEDSWASCSHSKWHHSSANLHRGSKF